MNREDKLLAKAFKRLAHKHKDEFVPYTISIDKMCERTEHPEYAPQLKNRLWREVDEHESYGDYLMISPSNPSDIFLTAEGMCIFNDILSCYFGPEALSAVMAYMLELNEAERNELKIKRMEKQFRQALKREPTDRIKNYVIEYKTHGTMCGVKMDDGICSLLTDELKLRSPLHLLRLSTAES